MYRIVTYQNYNIRSAECLYRFMQYLYRSLIVISDIPVKILFKTYFPMIFPDFEIDSTLSYINREIGEKGGKEAFKVISDDEC